MAHPDYVWVMHRKKKILVTDDPGVPVAVCTSKAEIEAGRAPGFFAGKFDNIESRMEKVKELQSEYPDYITDYESLWW